MRRGSKFAICMQDHRSQTPGYRQMAADCFDLAGARYPRPFRRASKATTNDTANTIDRSRETAYASGLERGLPQ